jgi:hypothetical protein
LKAGRVLHILIDVLDECRFIYAFLGSGIITCFVALIGHIAAETSHGFCLSCVSCLGALPLFSLKSFCVGIVLQNYILNKQVCEVHDLVLLGV